MNKKNLTQASNFIFTGCMFIGIAVGLYYNIVAIGTLIGIGTGFIFRGVINMKTEKNSDNIN